MTQLQVNYFPFEEYMHSDMKIRNRFPVVAKQKKHQLETDIEKVHIIYMAVNEMWK